MMRTAIASILRMRNGPQAMDRTFIRARMRSEVQTDLRMKSVSRSNTIGDTESRQMRINAS